MIVGAFEATLCLDGRSCEEYKTEYEPGSGRTHVVSQTDKVGILDRTAESLSTTLMRPSYSFLLHTQEISIEWKEDLSHPGAVRASIGYVGFDGLVQADLILDGGDTEATVTGQRISASRERPFVFSSIVSATRTSIPTRAGCQTASLMPSVSGPN